MGFRLLDIYIKGPVIFMYSQNVYESYKLRKDNSEIELKAPLDAKNDVRTIIIICMENSPPCCWTWLLPLNLFLIYVLFCVTKFMGYVWLGTGRHTKTVPSLLLLQHQTSRRGFAAFYMHKVIQDSDLVKFLGHSWVCIWHKIHIIS